MSPWSGNATRIFNTGLSGLGGKGNANDGCVTTGLFRARTWRKTNGQCLRRRFNGTEEKNFFK